MEWTVLVGVLSVIVAFAFVLYEITYHKKSTH
jgi:cell division protein FtsN